MLTGGQTVRVRRAGSDDEWCIAVVLLASDVSEAGSISVALALHSVVRTRDGGLIFNALPVTIDIGRETVTGLEGTDYEIEVLPNVAQPPRQLKSL